MSMPIYTSSEESKPLTTVLIILWLIGGGVFFIILFNSPFIGIFITLGIAILVENFLKEKNHLL